MEKQATDTQVQQAATLFKDAWTLAQQDRVEEASRGFLGAAEVVAGDAKILVDICSRLISINYDNEAINILTTASEHHPESREVWLTLGHALGKMWQLKVAIPAYERALELGSPAANDLLAYADLLFQARRPDEAKEAILKARELGASDPRTLYLQARCESIAGNHDIERQLLQDAITAKPDFGSAWEQLLNTTASDQLAAFAGDCIAQATGASTAANDKAVLLYTAGRAFDQLGEFGHAFDLFDKANDCQRSDAHERGLVYDKKDVEDYLRQVQQNFTEPQGGATSSNVDRQPIFIVGMVRSGTSLVEQILGGLDGVTTGGEADAIEVLTSKYYWSLNRGQAKPIGKLDATDWDELAAEYWQLQTVPESRVTDKAPLNFRHIGMMCAMFPDAPIIYMRRDPRDVALSIYSRYFSDAHFYATAPDNIAHFIGASQELMGHWQSVFPGRIIELEYEQLVADPETETRRLAEFCGLEWQASCLDFHKRGDASYTFSAAQIREPLNTKGIGRWRHYADQFAPFIDALAANDVTLPEN